MDLVPNLVIGNARYLATDPIPHMFKSYNGVRQIAFLDPNVIRIECLWGQSAFSHQ